MKAINAAMGATEWMQLIVLSILWGGSFFFVEIAVASLPPLTIVVLRVGLAALALHIIAHLAGLGIARGWRIWGAFLGMGILNNVVPFSLIVWGQQYISGGLASILNATTPFFVVLVAHFLTHDEKMRGGKLVGVIVGFSGVALMLGIDTMTGVDASFFALLAVLGAAASYAFAGVFGRYFRRLGVPPLTAATGQVTMSTVLLLPLALIFERPWELPLPNVEVWAAILALAFLSTALAYILYFRLLESAGATNVLLVTFLVPVSAITLGAIFLDERLQPQHLGGMALIAFGLAMIDGRLFQMIRRRIMRH